MIRAVHPAYCVKCGLRFMTKHSRQRFCGANCRSRQWTIDNPEESYIQAEAKLDANAGRTALAAYVQQKVTAAENEVHQFYQTGKVYTEWREAIDKMYGEKMQQKVAEAVLAESEWWAERSFTTEHHLAQELSARRVANRAKVGK